MEEALLAYLLAGEAVAGLVADRIYWDVRPQGEGLPAVVLIRAGGKTGVTYTGSDGLWRGRVQMNFLGATGASARAVERAVNDRINAKAFTQDGHEFQCRIDSVRDLTETGATDAEVIYCPSTDYIIIHKE